MQKLTAEGQTLVDDLSRRYNLSHDAVIHMIGAVNQGGGTMAQFNCPELGGSGQWMRGGMTMVGDMFNNGLKNTVENLCSEIANSLASTIIFPVIPPGAPGSNQWWPAELGSPFSSGAQNSTRYAIFQNRLAVDVNGKVTVYDTLDHNVGGISQQQGGNDSLTFSSQYGTIAVNSLPIVSGSSSLSSSSQTLHGHSSTTSQPAPPPVNNNFINPEQNIPEQSQNPEPVKEQNSSASIPANTTEIIQLIESLSRLRDAGALTDDEFNSKKSELLSRL